MTDWPTKTLADRRALLLAARDASARGDHDTARALFARVGASYACAADVARLQGALGQEVN